ncbi:protein PTST homolog 3, chloroplastic isoform X10 [Syzygium oleosum]|uniref:protein PTST homolog 3, chloroplastic isoform X10 n=1 Tax=Syzygium oleosum TaxID=219896 RepID=UPI0024B9B634|nr:protein PTST homolog 3, chloroplastic isoform X10 [Syzygium oleosum]
MAAPLPHLATCPSSSLSPHRLFFPYRLHRRELRFLSRGCSPGRRSAVCVASAGKSRSGRKTKSNVELCNDVKEFLASAGLPDGHVPSIKELLQHGRDDLAYIIRRRGYKLIRELLANSVEMKVYVSDRETSIAEEKEATIANEEGSEDQLPEVPTEIDDEENQSFTESDMSKPGTELQLETQNGEQSEHAHGESNGAMTPHISTARQFSPAKVHSPFRYSESSVEELFDADVGNNLDEERRKQENQAEISHLKFMLHQKELELSLLKEQNEKEKLALEMLQTKAENEISKAQKIVSEKDAELQAAEESLSGLKEVQIEYSGNGDIVEVAGSFNGWHHPIKMNPHPFATAKDTIGSRRSRYWSTMLWLYPGTYEIKFIVDGEWRIDPQKESVTRGTICNNVLQVDR